MRSEGKNFSSTITRRRFLKRAGAAAGAAGLAPAISAPFVATALAETKTLKIDTNDEVVKGTLVTQNGQIVHPSLSPPAAQAS